MTTVAEPVVQEDLEFFGIPEWEALDVPGSERWELVEGNLVMAPSPRPRHNRAAFRLSVLMHDADSDWKLLPEVEVALDSHPPATVRIPDLLLADPVALSADPVRLEPADVHLVVEVVSPGSRRTDYVAKRYDYELAGIPFYWIIDLDRRQVTCLELVDGVYAEVPVQQGDRVRLDKPVAIEFAWDDLT